MLLPETLTEDQLRGCLLPPVYARLRAGQGRFLAELRPAVALFMNFRGLDYDEDDAAGEKLDAYIRWVQGVLARHESYMLQLITGDKGSYLYAAFGAPLAHEDDPSRAVADAMDLQSLSVELDFIRDVRIGISQGRMRAGDYGGSTRRTYGVLSDKVNIAARLMGWPSRDRYWSHSALLATPEGPVGSKTWARSRSRASENPWLFPWWWAGHRFARQHRPPSLRTHWWDAKPNWRE